MSSYGKAAPFFMAALAQVCFLRLDFYTPCVYYCSINKG